MTAEDLFLELHRSGVKLERAGDKLRYGATKGALTPELRALIKAYKPDLLTLLTPDETLPDELVIPPPCLNTEAAIKACIDSQRVRKAVA